MHYYILGVLLLWTACLNGAEAGPDVLFLVDADSSYRNNPQFDYIKQHINYVLAGLNETEDDGCRVAVHYYALSLSPVTGDFTSCQDTGETQQQVNDTDALFDPETETDRALDRVINLVHDDTENSRYIILYSNGGAEEENYNDAIVTAEEFKRENDRSIIYVYGIGVNGTDEEKLREISSGDDYYTAVETEEDLDEEDAEILAEEILEPLPTQKPPVESSGTRTAIWCVFLIGPVAALFALSL